MGGPLRRLIDRNGTDDMLGRVLFLIAIAAALSGCRVPYAMQAVNYGRHGVIVLEVSHMQSQLISVGTAEAAGMSNLGGRVLVASLYPALPLESLPGAMMWGRFDGYETSLPDEVEVVWQLADLNNCEEERPAGSKIGIEQIRARGYDPEQHLSKHGCSWDPIPKKIYRQKLDMDAIRKSEAYTKAGSKNPEIEGSRYSLGLLLVFNEDQLKVETFSKVSNPWK